MKYISTVVNGRSFMSLVLFFLSSNFCLSQSRQVDNIQALARLDSLHKKADKYFENRPVEKVYVHFDKSFYAVGETSWYKAYIVTDPDFSPTDISGVLNIDWIDPSGKLIKRQRLKIEDGGAAGDFTIDSTLSEGAYIVRAYTNWMRNDDPDHFFYKRIQVYNTGKTLSSPPPIATLPKIDLQFFPEGGTLVAGLNTQVAFKAIDDNGSGIDVKGNILDEQNNVIAAIQPVHKGMGTFPFLPASNKTYRAVLQSGEVYPLPPAREKGFILSASNMNPNKILIRIQTHKEQSPVVYLLGHSRGSITYAGYVKMDGNTKDISISKDQLPEGIFRLTLLNSEGIPQCERKLFIKKDSSSVITVRSDKEKYARRDSIILRFNVADSKGTPVQTSLSLSVTDAKYTGNSRGLENIYTRLLLQSDMKGNIENASWYFDSSTAGKAQALDLVMLTHGWSGYNWEKILAPKEEPLVFMPENGITLEGQIVANNKPVANTNILLMIREPGNDYTDLFETDSLGQFYIPDLNFFDSTLVSFRVMKDKRVPENAKIRLSNAHDDWPDIEYAVQRQFEKEKENELAGKLSGRPVWKPDHYKMLDEVIVTGRAKKIRTVGMGAKLIKPDATDVKSKLSTSQFISRYAMGLPFSTLQTMPDGVEMWTGGMIMIDGVEADNTGFGGNPYLLLNAIPIEDIEHVLIRTKRKAYFISITTKKSSSQPAGIIRLMSKGYDTAREFYHPKYGPLDNSSTFPDTRITLYWDADIRTDKDGKATVKFYNTDYTARLHIVAEGIINGFPVSTTQILGK